MSTFTLAAATSTAILLGLAPQVASAHTPDVRAANYTLISASGSGCSSTPADNQHDGVYQATFDDLIVVNNDGARARSSQCTLRIAVRGASTLSLVSNGKGILQRDNSVQFSMRTSGGASASNSTTIRSTGDPDTESVGTVRSQVRGLNPSRTTTIDVTISMHMQGRESTLTSNVQANELTIIGS